MPFELDDSYHQAEHELIAKPPAGGWIKLYRQALVNGWLTNPYLWTFFTYCLLKASHKPHTAIVGFQKVKLDAGQFIFGRSQAASDLKMSERKIRTCQNLLISTNTLSVKTTNKFSIITIVNWNSYQQSADENDRQNDQLDGQRATSNRPASDQQVTTYKNEKKVKNGKNEKEVERDALALKGDSFLFYSWWGYAYQLLNNKTYSPLATDKDKAIELAGLEPRLVYLIFRASSFMLSNHAYYKQSRTITRFAEVWNDGQITEPPTHILQAQMLIPSEGEKLEPWLRSMGVIQ